MKLKMSTGKRVMRLLLFLLVLGAVAFAVLLGISAYMRAEVQEYILSPEQAAGVDADCILVLGAGVWGDEPSPLLEDRLLQGIDLYRRGASDRLLMSGDHGSKDYDETNVMKQYAIDAGVPSQDVFRDHAGFSTYESMYRGRDVFQVKSVIVVTQGYHLTRALYIARKLGLEARGVPSDPRRYAGQEYRDFRELLARGKDFFGVLLQPKPTYLGEAIPISGDGDLTNDEKTP